MVREFARVERAQILVGQILVGQVLVGQVLVQGAHQVAAGTLARDLVAGGSFCLILSDPKLAGCHRSMSSVFSGRYPIEHRAGEIERLRVQGAAMAPDTRTMLERIGVGPGWHCLDIGCGPGGITDLLSERAGRAGRVVGLDMDEEFLQHARQNAAADALTNVEFRRGDAYACDLPAGSFDLVHMRFVASTAGDPERLIREAMRLARVGGTVALQEPDASTLNCHPPHPAWDVLKAALIGAFAGVGADLTLARRLEALARQAGLVDLHARRFMLSVRAADDIVDYLPSTVESLRGTVLRLGLMTDVELVDALAACRKHLQDRGTTFTMYTVAQVWGRTPA